ncbi:hypothetical protein [Sphaerisporangium album]|uniref:hypothetical protein n=1 Tax=Sphaerisporangium album TaxID=509200 RepID=UPI0015F05889|nr:hypothetical protein [Sphaerisporangium album]
MAHPRAHPDDRAVLAGRPHLDRDDGDSVASTLTLFLARPWNTAPRDDGVTA